ncbi:MAG: TRAM domain-containing protein, partial [Muribaculaceae bacterium]|nr:TRAM domain-containing protein [Muribaculaceae bacterium]
MARKRKPLPLLEDVLITDVAAEGNALGRVDDMVVFVPFAAPGDRVDVQVEKKKKSYAQGRVARLRQRGDVRVDPKCGHFGICGGCRWQHLPYEYQLKCKRQQVVDALERIAKVDLPEIPAALGSGEIWEYRNKMEYTFAAKCWLTREQLESGEDFAERRAAGFHIPGAFDKVLDIDRCFLQDDLSNRIRKFVKAYGIDHDLDFYDARAQEGFLRTMMVRIAST